MKTIPLYVTLVFILTTLATLILLYRAMKRSSAVTLREKSFRIFLGLIAWTILQAVLTLLNVYNSNFNDLPPKIVLFGILPPMLFIVFLFTSKKGQRFIDDFPIKEMTLIHVVRIPVEIVLWWLCLYKLIPELMTFEGRNLDIIAGLSAPLIFYFGFIKKKLSRRIILVWNFICLGLLLNIVVHGFLSAPTPFQKFAFEQPNIALFEFPFSWLVSLIVPLVLFSHLVSIRQLVKKTDLMKQ